MPILSKSWYGEEPFNFNLIPEEVNGGENDKNIRGWELGWKTLDQLGNIHGGKKMDHFKLWAQNLT